MKTFNEFCAEAYQLDENSLMNALSNVKDSVKKLPLVSKFGAGLGGITAIQKLKNKDYLGAGLETASSLAYLKNLSLPGAVIGGVSAMRDSDIEKAKLDTSKAQAEADKLQPGARYYGRIQYGGQKPIVTPQQRLRDDERFQRDTRAAARYATRYYDKIGTQPQ